MHKHLSYFIVFCFLFAGISLHAQVNFARPDLIPYRDGKLWGYCNPEGKVIIKPKYGQVEFFRGGYARVRSLKDKHGVGFYGLINQKGKLVVPAIYEDMSSEIIPGCIAVKFPFVKSGKVVLYQQWGIIDYTGKIICPPKYSNIEPIGNNLCRAMIRKNDEYMFYLLGKNGKELMKYSEINRFEGEDYTLVKSTYKNEKGFYTMGYVDTTGQEVIPPVYYSLGKISNGVTWYMDYGTKKYGLVDAKGTVVIMAIFDHLYDFSGGRAKISLKDLFHENLEHVGFIDSTGRTISKVTYTSANSFVEGRALVTWDEKTGYINDMGLEVIPFTYDEGKDFRNGVALVREGKSWGAINKSGHKIVSSIYDEIYYASDNILVLLSGDKYGIYNIQGNSLTSPVYDASAGWPSKINFMNGYAVVKSEKKFGYLKQDGKLAFPMMQLDGVSNVNQDSVCFVEKNNKWGILDMQGRFIIPVQFDMEYEPMEEQGFPLLVFTGNDSDKSSFAILHKDGHIRHLHLDMDTLGVFVGGLCPYKQKGKWGYLDTSGNKINMKEYDALREFRFGLSLVTRDGKMGAIGHTGREVVPCKYDYIYNDGNPWILYLVYDDKDEYMSREGIPYFKN